MTRYSDYYKQDESSRVWWRDDLDHIGRPMFSFDKKKVHYIFGEDHRRTLTPEELAIFVEDEPYWAHFLGLDSEPF